MGKKASCLYLYLLCICRKTISRGALKFPSSGVFVQPYAKACAGKQDEPKHLGTGTCMAGPHSVSPWHSALCSCCFVCLCSLMLICFFYLPFPQGMCLLEVESLSELLHLSQWHLSEGILPLQLWHWGVLRCLLLTGQAHWQKNFLQGNKLDDSWYNWILKRLALICFDMKSSQHLSDRRGN